MARSKITLSLILALCVVLHLASCATQPVTNLPLKPQEIILRIDSNQPIERINLEHPDTEIVRSMDVPNPNGELSNMTWVTNGKGYVQIYSGLGSADVTRFRRDITILRGMGITDVEIYINSGGGGAFDGLALADEIERAQRSGFNVTTFASGIIASAAVPVFAVCNNRSAAPGTIFMVHEAALWKWPGRETASDIRSQNELMQLLRDRYISKLVAQSNLTREEWEALEAKTTWFSVEQALDWGLVDKIE